MKRTYIKDLAQNVGQEVVIKGWVDVRRDQGKMVFMDMRDMTGKVQCVVLPNYTDVIEAVKEVRTEWVLAVTGIVNKRPERNVKVGVMLCFCA
jgi:aspartyl-tRNA synthetase